MRQRSYAIERFERSDVPARYRAKAIRHAR